MSALPIILLSCLIAINVYEILAHKRKRMQLYSSQGYITYEVSTKYKRSLTVKLRMNYVRTTYELRINPEFDHTVCEIKY